MGPYPCLAGIEQFYDVETICFDERRRTRGGGYDDSSNDNNGRRGKCHNCGIRGHFARDCRKPKKKQEEENQEEALLCDAGEHPCLL
ncbi:hypothetical protein QYE76_015139 [Lolium multiflorum]|uniref:CCHC-type domain-containing protein n=1 Tax=Lolium multiflorum TaxID=4521 RepID=A0AAD8U6D8_LOLMU|nr:hypothetical protein QYE76_015139 [Lolium multiflorum]